MKEQFDIWLVNLNPARGTEAGKIRPALVIQTNLLNQLDHPSALICPITSQLSAEENILRVRLMGRVQVWTQVLRYWWIKSAPWTTADFWKSLENSIRKRPWS